MLKGHRSSRSGGSGILSGLLPRLTAPVVATAPVDPDMALRLCDGLFKAGLLVCTTEPLSKYVGDEGGGTYLRCTRCTLEAVGITENVPK
jgi:hypothetical protein